MVFDERIALKNNYSRWKRCCLTMRIIETASSASATIIVQRNVSDPHRWFKLQLVGDDRTERPDIQINRLRRAKTNSKRPRKELKERPESGKK